ncbi:hemin-degrading factor [Hymenobacter sp. HSC-4F20]|uniref:hemin-degrading factor n=1 Tax=Hymenobacter sp. HSC-4F20 TaxID=2864135 RepID=UPI001C738388|nr:ChuX/HutX family heme-like substrate-binding protein [Hymenobacter sp. HSC-4F20]MBX0290698.1 hemin-degrading factor [Hymenobacter sp. HSC-4F20]
METLTSPLSLAERWLTYQQENPKSRIRDAARALGVSEAELLATRCTGHANSPVTFLSGDFRELLKQVPTLGRVMALTRNDSAVHERKGEYQKVSFNGQMGLVLGEDIDLRLFMSHWQFGFAVEENGRRSLQFFAADGEAVHKIYLLEESNQAAYEALVAQYRASYQPATLTAHPTSSPTTEADDDAIDAEGFRAAWRTMTDTHEFFGLLRQYGVTRTQALRLGPPELLRQLDPQAIDQALRLASEQQLSVMIFVASRGCIQIHTGPTERIVPTGSWLNVLDPDFNLHLKVGDIAQAWAVQKPTADGIVTSVELYDAAGNNLLLLFGKRKPGVPELSAWRELVAAL